MKKSFKNLMALVLTGAMLTAGTAVFADDTEWTGSGSSYESSFTGTGGATELTGAKKIQVILPTTGTSKFILDTAGVFAMIDGGDFTVEKGGSVYFESDYDAFDDATGLIASGAKANAYATKSYPTYFLNKGIFPVNMKVEVKTTTTGSGMTVVPNNTTSFNGSAASIYLAAGVVDKDKAVITPDKAVGTGVDLYAYIGDSAKAYTVEPAADGTLGKFTYTDQQDPTLYAKSGIVYSGAIDTGYKWDAKMGDDYADTNTDKIKPEKFEINTKYTLSEPDSYAVTISNMAASAKTLVSIDGADSKATKYNIKFIDAAETLKSDTATVSATSGAISAKANGVEITPTGWETIYKASGFDKTKNPGVAKFVISADGGSQAAVVTLRP